MSLQQALSRFEENELGVQNTAINRASNKVESERQRDSRSLQALTKFSSTLSEELVASSKDRIKKEVAEAKALAIEEDFEKIENEGLDPVPPQERQDFDNKKEFLHQSDTAAKHGAKAVLDAGGSFEDSQKIANLSGWALYAYTAQKAQIAGSNYEAWVEGQMMKNSELKVELDGEEFTPTTARGIRQKQAAMKVLRKEFLKENDLIGINKTLLAEKGGFYEKVSAGHTNLINKYRKIEAQETSFKIKEGAINTFRSNKNFQDLFNSLLTTVDENGTPLSYEAALDESLAIIKGQMDTEEFNSGDLEALGEQQVFDPTTNSHRKFKDVRPTRFRKLEEDLVDAQEENNEYAEKKKKLAFESDVSTLIESLKDVPEDEYTSEYLRTKYQELKSKHGKNLKSDEFDAIIKQHAEGPAYQTQLGQAEDLLKAGLLTTAELRKFDYRIQQKYQNEAKLIDKATSKENAVDLKYLTDKVEFLANNSSIEKNDPTVGLMQEHIKRKYQSELAKAALAGDPNASQTARNVVDTWFTWWADNKKNLSPEGYHVPNMPTAKEIKQQAKHNNNEIKRQNKIIKKYGSKEAGGLGNLLKPENIVRLIPPEKLIESAQAYSEGGPQGFNYPDEVENIYRRYGSRTNTKHKIYKQIVEDTLGIKLGDAPPSVVKLEKYTSKADQIYLKEGGTDASTRFWGYTGQVSGEPNIEIVPDGVGEIVFNLSQESGMPFGELASGYEFFKANPKVAEAHGVSTTGEIDWNRFGLAMMHIKNQTGRGFQMAGEGAQAFGEGVVDFTENVQGRLSQFAEDTRTEVDAALEESLADNLALGEGLSGKAAGDWIAEQLINLGVDISKFGSDQVNNLINSILGDVPNLDEDQIRSFNNAAFKYEPSPENLNATKRARY